MNCDVERYLNDNRQAMIDSLAESIRIPSVEGEPEEGAPFGKAVKDALCHALELGERLGLATRNMEGYVGYIEHGSGDEMLGVICHVDVVPEGTGWKHPPYGAVIEDGIMYGRGTLDDKGPAIAAIYALAAIKAANIPLRRRVRIILGANEETGWGCMNYYKQHGEIPTLAFSPDAEYPVVNSEKGILHATFARAFGSRLRLNAGTRPNVVPGKTEAFVPVEADAVIEAAATVLPALGFDYIVKATETGAELTVMGLDAHASMPEQGRNSLQATLMALSRLPIDGTDGVILRGLNDALAMDMHGETLGLDRQDASGRLTLNPGVIRWNENGIEQLCFDVRHPISMTGAEVKTAIKNALDPLGLALIHEHSQDGHYIPADSELVSKLLDVYAKRTGEYLPPLAIGGGTYARAFENAVAFGCERPGIEAPVHMPNEFISLDDLMFNAHMIADAILALAE